MRLAKVFRDVDSHADIADIIVKHSTNQQDIREIALNGLNFRSCRHILDLGCAFGFFSRALEGKVPHHAKVTGIDAWADYQDQFMQSAQQAGSDSEFHAVDINLLDTFPLSGFDLILCSYALYFFPGIIPRIAQLMNPAGTFVTLTHASPHMAQLIEIIRSCLQSIGVDPDDRLPEEKLVEKFSSANGHQLLEPYFGKIKEVPYENSLRFYSKDKDDLLQYIRFKKMYFVPDTVTSKSEVQGQLEECIAARLDMENEFLIAKNDIIYICRKPRIPG